MPEKASFTMMSDQEVFKLLGKVYKNKFEIGQYVEWRTICRNENYEEGVKRHQVIIICLRNVDFGGRDVWYADIMKNGGETHLVLLSKIRKIETN